MMKIMPINNYQTTNFKAIYREPKAVYTEEQEKVVNNIKNELNKIDLNSKNNVSYLEALEDNFTDVLLKSNKDGDSIDMVLTKFTVVSGLPNSIEENVGKFNEKKPFTIESFQKKYDDLKNEFKNVTDRYLTVLTYIFLIGFGALAICTGHNKNKNIVTKPEQTKEIVTNFTDSIKKIKEIPFTIGRK